MQTGIDRSWAQYPAVRTFLFSRNIFPRSEYFEKKILDSILEHAKSK